MSAVCKHLESAGVDLNLMWGRIYDLIVKSILSAENLIFVNTKKLVNHRSNCFELFGFDVILDSELKPWLLEVNLSPALSTDSPLDAYIKGNLISDTLTLIGIRQYDKRTNGEAKAKWRLKAWLRM